MFKNVEFLVLNYNCIFEDVIVLFVKILCGKLDMINIKVCKFDFRYYRISGGVWGMLKWVCFKLVVLFWFENIG